MIERMKLLRERLGLVARPVRPHLFVLSVDGMDHLIEATDIDEAVFAMETFGLGSIKQIS